MDEDFQSTMRSQVLLLLVPLVVFLVLEHAPSALSLSPISVLRRFAGRSSSSIMSATAPSSHPFCDLPGDPSLLLTTNVDLGDQKLAIMKACSKAIAKHTGKPESYVAVSITDKASVIFGGSDAPTALGCLYSIGSIAQGSNGQITDAVTEALAPFGVEEDRIYINFFDVPRANVGWSRRTFAG